jgi:hypothetical protein
MKVFRYKTTEFHPKIFYNDNVIVDNEIANDIAPHWDYTKGIPVVTGMLYQDQAVIFVADSVDDEQFKAHVMGNLSMMFAKADLYSFNANMEIGNFKGAWDFDIKINEIKPFKAKGWNKDRFYNELVGHRVIPDTQILDPFGGDAGQCVVYWERYWDTHKNEFLMKIVLHNLNCLLKESVILNNIAYFKREYQTDKNGFLVED